MPRPLDVIVIKDGTITPPGPKMVVCIHPDQGWFYRINTRPWRPAVVLSKAENSFLDHDSWLECGDPLELDDYLIDEAMRRHGVVGRVSTAVVPEILRYLAGCRWLTAADKAEIRRILTGPSPD